MKIDLKDYEKYLARLDEIIVKLNSADISLDESISLYKEGIEIYKALSKLLNDKEHSLKVFKDGEFVELENQDE